MADSNFALERHRMIWVTPSAWAKVLANNPQLDGVPLVSAWASAGWPLVVRSAVLGDSSMMAPLGLPLPPAWGRRRLSLRVPLEALYGDAPPPLLKAAAMAAPAAWQTTIALLLDLDPEVRCFGSLAWQYLTGLPYLTTNSDIDLSWSVTSATNADMLTSRIELIADSAPMRIDGELLAPSRLAVQWREWSSCANELLVKSTGGVRLMVRREWLQ